MATIPTPLIAPITGRLILKSLNVPCNPIYDFTTRIIPSPINKGKIIGLLPKKSVIFSTPSPNPDPISPNFSMLESNESKVDLVRLKDFLMIL